MKDTLRCGTFLIKGAMPALKRTTLAGLLTLAGGEGGCPVPAG